MKRAGVAPALPALSAPGLAVGLGGVGITLRDLVQLYAAIARGGDRRWRSATGSLRVPVTAPGAPVLEPDGGVAGRRHPRRRAAARQRLARPRRLQDRHLLRLSRRLGGRFRRPQRGRRLDRPAGRHAGARTSPASTAPRRSCSRRSAVSGPRRAPLPAAAAGRADRHHRRTAAAAPPLPPPRRDGGHPRHRPGDRLSAARASPSISASRPATRRRS